jgi:hypothetical protein
MIRELDSFAPFGCRKSRLVDSDSPILIQSD